MQARVRVILTGQTGLERSLRKDRRIELIRAANAFDTIGELSDPIDDESPEPTVVVLGRDVDPGPDARGEHGRIELREAIQLVDPEARVLASQEGAPTGLDGIADADGRWLDAMLATDDHRDDNNKPTKSGQAAGLDASLEQLLEAPDSGEDVGDAAIVQAMIQGGGKTIETALNLLRVRLHRHDLTIEYTTRESGARSVPLMWRNRPVGSLTWTGSRPADIEAHAEWLAGWIVLEQQHAQLRDAAFRDSLTGAYNRRYFDRFLNSAIDRARNERETLSLFVFDIDNFKRFNDEFGHAAGDEILCEAVRLMEAIIRPSDRVCRIGGDEFAVIFFHPEGPREHGSLPPDSVRVLAQRFQRQVREHRFPKLGRDAPGTLTISGGLATFPWDGQNATDLLEQADQLALRSKRQGKNAITLGPGALRLEDPA